MDKDLNENFFIPAEELGMDPSGFTVDPNYWYNEMYELYKDSCHFDNSLDPKLTNEAYRPLGELNSRLFCVLGRVGYFRWYALTLFYDEAIHKMDDQKRKYNLHHQKTICEPESLDAGANLLHAINNNKDLVNILQRNPVVGHMPYLFDDENFMAQFELESRLSNFLDLGVSGAEIYTNKNGRYEIIPQKIKGKDVVLPFIWANKRSLDFFGNFAKSLADNGANTVVGIFATRIVPTIDGKEGFNVEGYEPMSFNPPFSFTF